MSIVAIVPVASMAAANQALEEAGFGPRNFSVQCFGATGCTHAALSCWPNTDFLTALQSIPNVTIGSGDIATLIASAGARWGDKAPELPTSGNAVANTLYRHGDDELWWCIQTFNRSTFNAHPSTYPALIRRMRRPGDVLEWKQPTDAFDAYKLVNPFTGQPDRALLNGQRWRVNQADSAGNNVWQPGVFGWVLDP